jgi:uncharacterized repeat protein (TIGR03803 family)
MKKLYILICLFIGIGNSSAQYSKIFNFNYTTGASPYGALIISGSTMYGITTVGGSPGSGCIFSISTAGTNDTNLHNCNSSIGDNPHCSLVRIGGMLFGTNFYGGPDENGNVFSIDTNGNNYKDILDFTGSNGRDPFGSLTVVGNLLYGFSGGGGAHGFGSVFSIDTNGNNFIDRYDFTSAEGEPQSALILSGIKLYGMIPNGGTKEDGCVFSIDTTGNGYKDLHDFNDTAGYQPFGDVTIAGGVLYGMTSSGGANDSGCIFSVDTSGNGFKDLYDLNGVSGWNPFGDLTIVGDLMYGMTKFGGKYGEGVVFSIDTNGNNYTDLLDLDDSTGNYPFGSLTLSGSALYGETWQGGSHNYGTIFMIDTSSTSSSIGQDTGTYLPGQTYTDVWYEPSNCVANDTDIELLYTNISGGATLSPTTTYVVPVDSYYYPITVTFTAPPTPGNYYYELSAENIYTGDSSTAFMNVIVTNTPEINSTYIDTFYAGADNIIDITIYNPTSLNECFTFGEPDTVSLSTFPKTKVMQITDSNFVLAPGDSLLVPLDIHSADTGTYTFYLQNLYNGGHPTYYLFNLTFDLFEGINRLSANSNQLSIYPNPASNQLTITSKQLSINRVEITNVLGQVIFNSPSGDFGLEKIIDVSSLPDGMYFIAITSGNETALKKFLITK